MFPPNNQRNRFYDFQKEAWLPCVIASDRNFVLLDRRLYDGNSDLKLVKGSRKWAVYNCNDDTWTGFETKKEAIMRFVRKTRTALPIDGAPKKMDEAVERVRRQTQFIIDYSEMKYVAPYTRY